MIFPPLKKNCSSARGFTLLEMLVSVALFSIVIVIVAAAYINLINLDRQTRATNDVVDNLSFSIDSMSRSIRTGSGYACSPGDSNGNGTCHQFSFFDSTGCYNTYYLSGGLLESSITDPKGTNKCLVGSGVPLTASAVNIDTLTFYVRGVGSSDGVQPLATFVVHGTVYVDSAHPSISFTIQSSANQRNIEL